MTGQGPRESNERLEFLGDSVLGLATSEYLYRLHPGEHEGQLTKTKSLLVSKAILSRRALAMGLGRFVLMSHSEIESGGRQRLSFLADADESEIGAGYLDQGFDAAKVIDIAFKRYDVSLGAGLSELAGKVFRIGHLGDMNALTLAGALGGIEMALVDAGIPVTLGSGVGAALQTWRVSG